MFAGSHWLTHLGPGNTPIPTYPWIQLKWHKTVTVKGDSQHRVTYNRWITFCKSKSCALTSTAVLLARAKWCKRWDTKRGNMRRCERSLQSCYVTTNIRNLEMGCRGVLLFTSAHITGAIRLQAAIALSRNCSSKATATPLREKRQTRMELCKQLQ